MEERRVKEVEKKGRTLVGMKDNVGGTTQNTSNQSPQDVATASQQNVAATSPQDAETNPDKSGGSSNKERASTVEPHRSNYVVSLTRSTRSKTGKTVGVHYMQSKNQQKSLDAQLKGTNGKKTKVTGAAGEVNNEYYDFRSITVDKVKKITSDEGTYLEMKNLVGNPSMTSVFMKDLWDVEENLQLALMIYLNREEVLKKYDRVIGNTYHLRDQLDEYLKQELMNESGYEYDETAVNQVIDFRLFEFSK